MRLVSYGQKWQERAGILTDGVIVDLESAMRAAGAGVPTTDVRLLLEQPDWRRLVEKAFAARRSTTTVEARSVRLGAPVPVPRQLLIAGANTKSHLAEAKPVLKDVAPPREPMILAKATSSLCGPFDEVIHPPETKKLDYEVELGVVIGKRCRRIKESEVRDHIAGYLTVNEMSARDIQLAEHESNSFYRVHFIGKSFDTVLPDGPGPDKTSLQSASRFRSPPLRSATFLNTSSLTNRNVPRRPRICSGNISGITSVASSSTVFSRFNSAPAWSR